MGIMHLCIVFLYGSPTTSNAGERGQMRRNQQLQGSNSGSVLPVGMVLGGIRENQSCRDQCGGGNRSNGGGLILAMAGYAESGKQGEK